MTHTFRYTTELLSAAAKRGVSLPFGLAVDLALEIAVQKHHPASGLFLLGGHEFHLPIARLLSSIYDIDLLYLGANSTDERADVQFILSEAKRRARFRNQILLLSSFDSYTEELRGDVEKWDQSRNREHSQSAGCVIPLYGVCLPEHWSASSVRWTTVRKVSISRPLSGHRTLPGELPLPQAPTMELSSAATLLLELFVCEASRQIRCPFPRARRMEQICIEAAILQSWGAAPLIPAHTLRQAFGHTANYERVEACENLAQTIAKIAHDDALADHNLATSLVRELYDRTVCA